MEQRGQIQVAIAMIVALAIGVIVVGYLFSAMELPKTTTYTTYTTTNPAFTSNATGWDNYVESNAVNDWNSGGYITTTVTDNLDVYENGIWSQALSVASIYDGVTSATLSFKYRIIDNDNLSAIGLAVYLDNGTDNNLIWVSTSTAESESWTTQENNVASVVTAAGTYTVYLRAEIKPDTTEAASNIVVGFDDASLSVVASETAVDAAAKSAYDNIQAFSWIAMTLMSLGIIIFGAMVVLSYVRGGRSAGA